MMTKQTHIVEILKERLFYRPLTARRKSGPSASSAPQRVTWYLLEKNSAKPYGNWQAPVLAKVRT